MVPYSDETVGIKVEYTGSNDLAECIAKLPPRQRSAIVLKCHHGHDLKTIAQMLGITYANALKTEYRAKFMLICQRTKCAHWIGSIGLTFCYIHQLIMSQNRKIWLLLILPWGTLKQ